MSGKAQIRVQEGTRQGEVIEVMYNPPEYSVEQNIDASNNNNQIQFNRVNIPEFTVKLFFDTYESRSDVKEHSQKIVSLMEPSVGEAIRRPPRCRFVWGSFWYEGIVSKCSQHFIMFLSSGIPVRVELTVTFMAVMIEEKTTQLSNRQECRKYWTVKSNDRLDLIANSVYQNPSQWKIIAEANGIVDPLSFPDQQVGSILIIPESAV